MGHLQAWVEVDREGGVGEGWERGQEQVGVALRQMGDTRAGFGCVSQGTAQVVPLNGHEEAGDGWGCGGSRGVWR